MPTKQQKNLFRGLLNRLVHVLDDESDIFWEERPWLENRYCPIPWVVVETPERETRKKRLHKQFLLISGAIDKLYNEMYPKEVYPQGSSVSTQEPLIEGVVPSRQESKPHITHQNPSSESTANSLETLNAILETF